MDKEDNNKTPISGFANWASGDSNTTKDLMAIAAEQRVRMNDVFIHYDDGGGSTAQVELYDDQSGTSQGSVTDQVDEYELDPGNKIEMVGVTRDEIDKGLVGLVNNNDDSVQVTVGGEVFIG
jgi:hypothetical protein